MIYFIFRFNSASDWLNEYNEWYTLIAMKFMVNTIVSSWVCVKWAIEWQRERDCVFKWLISKCERNRHQHWKFAPIFQHHFVYILCVRCFNKRSQIFWARDRIIFQTPFNFTLFEEILAKLKRERERKKRSWSQEYVKKMLLISSKNRHEKRKKSITHRRYERKENYHQCCFLFYLILWSAEV